MTKQEKMAAAPVAYLKALVAQDLDGIIALYADDAVVEDPVGSEPHVGIEAVRAFYAGAVALNLGAELTGQTRIAGDEVAFPFKVTNASFGISMNIIDVFKFNDEGQICSMRAFWGEANSSPL